MAGYGLGVGIHATTKPSRHRKVGDGMACVEGQVLASDTSGMCVCARVRVYVCVFTCVCMFLLPLLFV